MDWFGEAGEYPTPHIELNFDDAIRSLVLAGYGASLLPLPDRSIVEVAEPEMIISPLSPLLWRHLGLAFRPTQQEPATRYMVESLMALKN
jgi:DNA-binding transcriptional LysR family regulator